MKLKTLLLAATVVLTAGATRADHQWNWDMKDRWKYEHDSNEKFTANEFSLDAFGLYRHRQREFTAFPNTNIRHGGRFGGGVGMNYFFTRNFGLGADSQILDNGGDFIDNASGNVIFRWPIGCVAPYVFGGGGREFGPHYQWTGDAGGGVEFRLNHWTGIFADARYVFTAKTSDYALIRAGLRLAF